MDFKLSLELNKQKFNTKAIREGYKTTNEQGAFGGDFFDFPLGLIS